MRKKLHILKSVLIFLISVSVFFSLFSVCIKTAFKTLYPIKYEESVIKYSEEYGVDKELIFAVIKTESSFNPDSVSDAGAMGLMQIMPDTLDWLSGKLGETDVSVFDEDTAIKYGTYLLKILTDEFGYVETAIAAYHAGIGNVHKWLSDSRYSSDGKTLDKIPFSDTAHYVGKVSRAVEIYNNLY